jgi:hypothetical protein
MESIMTKQAISKFCLSSILFVLGVCSNANAQQFKAPKGTNCSEFFASNAKVEAGGDDIYISPERIGFMSVDHVYGMYSFATYTKGTLFLISNLLKDHATCLQAESQLAIKFVGQPYVFVEKGKHKHNCIPGRMVEEKKFAMGLHPIPINSLMFKSLLTQEIEYVGVETTTGAAVMAPMGQKEKDAIRNVFRCAYEAVGKGIDLSDDSVLINNSRPFPKKSK